MNHRREISKAYKERRLRGGVYAITNSRNGKYLLCHTANLASAQNRFQFAVTTGGVVDPRLRRDWEEFGAAAFTLEVLEEVDQAPEQSQAALVDDLKTLEQLWRADLDPSQAY
jgi:hypothetical protein